MNKVLDIGKVKLILPNNQTLELPLYQDKENQQFIDVSNLDDKNIFTYDNGLGSTAFCTSGITYIDGPNGILRYRGYNIAELAQHSTFLEVFYLLFYGELPTETQHNDLIYHIKRHMIVHEQIKLMYRGFPRSSHPMAIMAAAVNSLSAFYHDNLDIHNPYDRFNTALRLIAKMPTLASMCYKYSIGQSFIHPTNKLDYTSNFLNMMFATKAEEYVIHPIISKALNILFILHADHEQNASSATIRLVGSCGSNPFATIGAGIAALWGPLHGGATEAVIKMLKAIKDIKNVPDYINDVKNKKVKLMGFGHRVYRHYDPRANIIKNICMDILKIFKYDPLLDIALALEEIALKDPYFIERKLYPNVDFYSGLIYKAIGIPENMFTVMFAIARTAGWISQWNEMLADTQNKINRPRQIYIGNNQRDYQVP
jgi:citrate synthase